MSLSDTSSLLSNIRAPNMAHSSRSFSRMESSPSTGIQRNQASTPQDDRTIHSVQGARSLTASQVSSSDPKQADVFDYSVEDDDVPPTKPDLKISSTADELPIEIKSLVERFLEGLSAKVHPTPLNADALSDMFQDFYERAASHISTHTAALASQIGRQKRSTPSSGLDSGKTRSRAGSGASRSESPASTYGGEMLTASEVADRRRARRNLELKKTALEDAVERVVCERVYDRIFKHRSTDDDERDEKLRSRTAALAVVGIGLKELHLDSDPSKLAVKKVAEQKEHEINQSLAGARSSLQHMDDEHNPLGKLQHLVHAHQRIVETLSEFFPSSSSADEVLPALIYTLITSPPEGVNVVSNLHFIQRFRWLKKMDGEAAYCLVNLEAAVSFLETVDLSSLRSDELPGGPPKSGSKEGSASSVLTEQAAPVSQKETPPPLKPASFPLSVTADEMSSPTRSAAEALRKTPGTSTKPVLHQRRLSELVQAQASRLEYGRDNLLSAADKMYDSINGTLESSLQFVFGRFRDQVSGVLSIPRTLEEARKLVNSPRVQDDDDTFPVSGRSSPSLDDARAILPTSDSKVVELIGGRKSLRESSVDNAKPGSSAKRPMPLSEAATKEKPKEDNAVAQGGLFSQINRFGVPGFARFARSPSLTGNATLSQPPPLAKAGRSAEAADSRQFSKEKQSSKIAEEDETDDATDMSASQILAKLRRINPPYKRFLEAPSAADLKIGEIEDLLLEYKRLAKAIGDVIAE